MLILQCKVKKTEAGNGTGRGGGCKNEMRQALCQRKVSGSMKLYLL